MAAQTALATQLRQLAVRSVPVAARPVSLLFDEQDAADLDIETVHGLGVNGLAELTTIDGRFAAFEDTLFHPRLRSWQRSLETAAVNRDLDRDIERLLLLLSPHLLLQPAHKVFEWLFRQLRIGDFNIDAVLRCVLPYHETNLFVRIVQLLRLRYGSAPPSPLPTA